MSRLPKVSNPHRRLYPSDLRDREWKVIKPLLPAPKGFGRPRTVNLREILNAIFYVQVVAVSGKCCPIIFRIMAQSTNTSKNANA